MSAPNENPGEGETAQVHPNEGTQQASASGPGSGGDVSGVGSPVPGSDEQAEQQQQHNYEKRFRDTQSKLDTLQSKLGGLTQYIEQGGNTQQLQALAQIGNAVMQEPTLAGVVQKWSQTGKVDFPGSGNGATEDEDLFGEEVSPKVMQDVKQLRDELARLKAAQHQTSQMQGGDRLRSLMGGFLGDYPALTQEEASAFEQKMLTQMDGLATQTPQAVISMTDKTFRMIAREELESVVPTRTLAQRELQSGGLRNQQAATDAPLGVGTTGQEIPSRDSKQLARMDVRTVARQAMREAFEKRRSGN